MSSFKKPALHCSKNVKKGNCLCKSVNKCLKSFRKSIATEIRKQLHPSQQIPCTSSHTLGNDSDSGSHVAQKKSFKKLSKRSSEPFQKCSCRVKRTKRNKGKRKLNDSNEIARSSGVQLKGGIVLNENHKAFELNVNCTLLLNKSSETFLKLNQSLNNSKEHEDQNLEQGFDLHGCKKNENNSNNSAYTLNFNLANNGCHTESQKTKCKLKMEKRIASSSGRENSKDARDFLQNIHPLTERTAMSSSEYRDMNNEHLLRSEVSSRSEGRKNCCIDSPSVLNMKQEKFSDYYQSPDDGNSQRIKHSSINVNDFHIAPQSSELKSEKFSTDFTASSLQDMEIKSKLNLLTPRVVLKRLPDFLDAKSVFIDECRILLCPSKKNRLPLSRSNVENVSDTVGALKDFRFCHSLSHDNAMLISHNENLVAVKQETDINLNTKEKCLDGMSVHIKTEPVENEIYRERRNEADLFFSSKQNDNIHIKSERYCDEDENLDGVKKLTNNYDDAKENNIPKLSIKKENNYDAAKENNIPKLSIKKEKDDKNYDTGCATEKPIRKQNAISEVKKEYDTDNEAPIHDTVDDYFDFDNRVNDVDEKELQSRIIWPETPDDEYKNIFQDLHASQTVFHAEDCLHHSMNSSKIGENIMHSKNTNKDMESQTTENETKEQSMPNNDSVRSTQVNVELPELFIQNMSKNDIFSRLHQVSLPLHDDDFSHQLPVNCCLFNIDMTDGKHGDKELLKSETVNAKVEESSSNDGTTETHHSDNMLTELTNPSVTERSYTYISQAGFHNEDHLCDLPLDSLTDSNVFDKKIDIFGVVSESTKDASVPDSNKQTGLSILSQPPSPLDGKCFIDESTLSGRDNINVNGRVVRSEGTISDVCKREPNSKLRTTKHKLKPNNSSNARKKLKPSLKENIEHKIQCPNELSPVIKKGTCGLEAISPDELKSNDHNTQALNIKSPTESTSSSLKKSKRKVICTKTKVIQKSKKLAKSISINGPSLHCNSNIESCLLEGTTDQSRKNQKREDPLRNYKIPKRKVTKKQEIHLKSISSSSKDEHELPLLRNDIASKLKVTDSNISFENRMQKVLPLPQQATLIEDNISLLGNNDNTKLCQPNNDQETQSSRMKSDSEANVCVSKRVLPTLRQRYCVNHDERSNLTLLVNETTKAKKRNRRRGIKPRQVKSRKKIGMHPAKKLLLPTASKPTPFKCRSPKTNEKLNISIQRPSYTRNYVSPENFIVKVVHWNTNWLQEQQHKTTPPPVVNFSSIDDDKKAYFKLTLFNLWNSVSESLQNYAAKDIEFAIIKVQPFEDVTLLTCQTVIATNSSEVLEIRDGHLTVIEVLFNSRDETVYMQRMFGYVCSCKKENYSARSAHPLLHECILNATHSCQLVNFVIIIKRRKDDVEFSKLMKIKPIKHIKNSLEHCKSLQNMHHCIYCKWTFTPQLDLCLLDEESSLQSSTPYNDTQKCAILNISSAMFFSKKPRLLFLFGQPGTGKTHTVMGIIQRLLFLQSRKTNQVKILIASPSASALEEIGFRLLKLNSVLMSPGRRRRKRIRLVFLEQEDNGLKNWSIDQIVKRRLQSLTPEPKIEKAFQNLQKKINVLKQEKAKLRSNSMDSVFKMKNEELNNAIKNVNFFRKHLGLPQEQMLRTDILRKANVILTTVTCLRRNASRYFNEGALNFTCCIIDEATHCTEPEILIPLQHGINKVLLVGSTNDVQYNISPERLAKHGFLFSLYEKLNKQFKDSSGRNPIFLLTEQHRMHPEIYSYPFSLSYFGHINSGNFNEHFADFPLKRYQILNITDFHKNALVLDSENFLKHFCGEILQIISPSCTVGIIAADERQKETFKNYFDCTISLKQNQLEVNTIGGFQGREFDIIVVSCIMKSTDSSSVGFMHDAQKFNIAITRARHSLIICGHLESLRTNQNWDALIKDAEARKLIFPVNSITVKQASEFVKTKTISDTLGH